MNPKLEYFEEFLEWGFGHYNDSSWNSLGSPVLLDEDTDNPYITWSPGHYYAGYAAYSYNEFLEYKAKGLV